MKAAIYARVDEKFEVKKLEDQVRLCKLLAMWKHLSVDDSHIFKEIGSEESIVKPQSIFRELITLCKSGKINVVIMEHNLVVGEDTNLYLDFIDLLLQHKILLCEVDEFKFYRKWKNSKEMLP